MCTCLECDFKIPSRIGEVTGPTLLVEDIGRPSLVIAIVCNRDNIERLHARVTTAMTSPEIRKAVLCHTACAGRSNLTGGGLLSGAE